MSRKISAMKSVKYRYQLKGLPIFHRQIILWLKNYENLIKKNQSGDASVSFHSAIIYTKSVRQGHLRLIFED